MPKKQIPKKISEKVLFSTQRGQSSPPQSWIWGKIKSKMQTIVKSAQRLRSNAVASSVFLSMICTFF